MTLQHLNDLVVDTNNPATTKPCEALAELANVMMKGSVSGDTLPVLDDANWTAFCTKEGGVRPIAIDTTLRRLTAKMICARSQKSMGLMLRPVQLDVGAPAGSEAVVHTVRHFYDSVSAGVKVIVKLDY